MSVDLSKVCNKLREKYELKSFSVSVNRAGKKIDVHTSEDQEYQSFMFEGYEVIFLVNAETKPKEMSKYIEEIVSNPEELVEEIMTDPEEVETLELVEEKLDTDEWKVPDFEDIDFDKF